MNGLRDPWKSGCFGLGVIRELQRVRSGRRVVIFNFMGCALEGILCSRRCVDFLALGAATPKAAVHRPRFSRTRVMGALSAVGEYLSLSWRWSRTTTLTHDWIDWTTQQRPHRDNNIYTTVTTSQLQHTCRPQRFKHVALRKMVQRTLFNSFLAIHSLRNWQRARPWPPRSLGPPRQLCTMAANFMKAHAREVIVE